MNEIRTKLGVELDVHRVAQENICTLIMNYIIMLLLLYYYMKVLCQIIL